MSLHLALAQDGTEVTGTLELSGFPDAEMSDGVVEGSTLFFGLHVPFDGQWFSVWVGGAVDGDEISGAIELPRAWVPYRSRVRGQRESAEAPGAL